MDKLVSSFYNHLKDLIGTPDGKRFLLTVSGGKDSVAVTHLFHELNLTFEIAHCNFHLREDDSNLDMQFVKELAEKWNISLHIKEFDTFNKQKQSGKSIEMVARELRYSWFDEIGQHFDYIVTAHHANDNAETILLNLTRGTGLKGLTGIPAINGKYIRPLLLFSSAEIMQYIERHNLTFRTDKSNFSEEYQRNRIRHSVIPQLEEINPQLIATFSQNIAHFQQQYAFFTHEIERYRSNIMSKNDNNYYLNIEKLLTLPDAELILFELLKPFDFSSSTIQEIYQALGGQPGKQFFSPTHILVKNRNELIIRQKEDNAKINIKFESIEKLEKFGFNIDLQDYTKDITFHRDPQTIYIDAKKLHSPLTLRNWEDGDFFYPFGMKGKKKLSDFFVDQKVDLHSKRDILILCSQSDIVWVIGYRADNRFGIDANTKQYYKITYHGRNQ